MDRRQRDAIRGRLPLGWVIASALLVVAVLPGLVASTLLFGDQRDQLEADALDRLRAIASAQAARFGDYLERSEEAARLVASRTQLRLSLAEMSADGDPDGTELGRTQKILTDAVDASELVMGVSVVDADGVVVTADDASEIGSERNAGPDLAVGEIDIGAIGRNDRGELVLEVRAALDVAAEADLTALVEISAEPLRELTSDFTGLGSTGETIIAQRTAEDNALFVTPLRFDADAALQREVSADAVEVPITRALRGDEVVSSEAIDYRGEPVFAVSEPVAGDFGLVVKIDRSEALRAIGELRESLLVAMLSALLLIAVLTVLVTRRLTSPVRSLTSAATAVAGGDHGRRAQVQGPKEIATLAVSVNQMTEELVRANEDLEVRVAQRTRELDAANAGLEQANAALLHRAMHDPLTGLPNRMLLLDRLEQALARGLRERCLVAVLFCDLDRFNIVNDSLGHEAGDRLLVEVADRISCTVRTADTVARIGGDEFIVVLGDLSEPRDVTRVADKIRSAIEKPVLIDGNEAHVSVSIGVVVVDGSRDEIADPGALLSNADAAMLAAKEKGRARWEFFGDDLVGKAERFRALEADLHRAIAADEFTAHYQPVVELATGRIVGVEALLRWHHPNEGVLPPGRFLATAEETGLIVEIGDRVLNEACDVVARWNRDLDIPIWLAINMSGRQLGRADFSNRVGAALAEAGLDPELLRLEITERAIQQTSHSAVDDLITMRSLGVRLGLGDFGSGTTSLTILQTMSVDFFKIDRRFTATLDGPDPAPDAIVRSLAELADGLRIDAVAEGVETPGQRGQLQDLGVTLGQGFLFGRPTAAEKLEADIRRGRLADLEGQPQNARRAGRTASHRVQQQPPTGKE